MAAAVADGAQQRQLAPPLQHVPEQHGRQPQRAEREAEPAEQLEGREVGVLDAVEAGEALGGGRGVEAEVGEALFERGGDLGRTLGRGHVEEEEAVALLLGEEAEEVALRHQQLALKDAVGEGRDDPQADGLLPAAALQHEVLAELEVEDVGQRVGVGRDRDGAVLELARKCEPRALPLLARRAGG